MMKVFCIYGIDNESFAFRESPELTSNQELHQAIVPDTSGQSRSSLNRCEECGDLRDKWNESLENLVLKKRKFDISSTYDGIVVVSTQFKSVYESAGLSGLTFRPLPGDKSFYAIRADRIVEYDAEQRGSRFIKPCPRCGSYESVVGATPVYFKSNVEVAPSEFVRTNLEFGSNDEKSPLLICGEAAAESLKEANLKGLEMEQVQESATT